MGKYCLRADTGMGISNKNNSSRQQLQWNLKAKQ